MQYRIKVTKTKGQTLYTPQVRGWFFWENIFRYHNPPTRELEAWAWIETHKQMMFNRIKIETYYIYI